MSTGASGPKSETPESEPDHPIAALLAQYFSAITILFTPQYKYKIRRAFETAILIVITLGMLWWLYELTLYLTS
jgi:hypothetical protein